MNFSQNNFAKCCDFERLYKTFKTIFCFCFIIFSERKTYEEPTIKLSKLITHK